MCGTRLQGRPTIFCFFKFMMRISTCTRIDLRRAKNNVQNKKKQSREIQEPALTLNLYALALPLGLSST